MEWLPSFMSGCCTAPRHMPSSRDTTEQISSFTYRKETLSAADYHALARSLRQELDVPDVSTPAVGFLPSLSEVDRDLRSQEDRSDAFSSLVNYAVCGLLESRLRSNEVGLVFDQEERQLLVASANQDLGFRYHRVPMEPSGVTVEDLKEVIQDKAKEGLLFVSNTLSSLTFEPAWGVAPPLDIIDPCHSSKAARSRPPETRLSRNQRREMVSKSGSKGGRCSSFTQVPGIEVKLEALPDGRVDVGYWKLVTKRVQEEAKKGWTLRAALRIPNVARVLPGAVDVERPAHSHLVYSKNAGSSFPLSAKDTWREAVEFAPVRAHGPEVDGSLMNKGVFETIRVWASQGWFLQTVFFCELPLGDHGRDETVEVVSGQEFDDGSGPRPSLSCRSSAAGSSRTSRSAKLQVRKCKYAMRYHSLLYFARPSTTASQDREEGCVMGI